MALTRNVSELFGPIGGAALMYTVSSVALLIVMGIPKVSLFTKRYLLIGGTLFVCYEIFLALSLGLAHSRHQAMEMAVINYLWPALTVLLTVILAKRKVHILVYPSVLVAFIGVAWCIAGDNSLSLFELARNVQSNPVSYVMAFSAAFIWAIYCNVTQKMSGGKNAITLFFMATAATLWVQYAFSDESQMVFTYSSIGTLLVAGVVMGAGYAFWNQAIIGGNMMLLATISYFTPIFSTLFSSVYLSVALGWSFWQGVVLVTLGSLVCYWATKEKPDERHSQLNSAQN